MGLLGRLTDLPCRSVPPSLPPCLPSLSRRPVPLPVLLCCYCYCCCCCCCFCCCRSWEGVETSPFFCHRQILYSSFASCHIASVWSTVSPPLPPPQTVWLACSFEAVQSAAGLVGSVVGCGLGVHFVCVRERERERERERGRERKRKS